jgi:protein O-mannosyl-transferase
VIKRWSIAGLAVLASVTSILNGFAYDDVPIIVDDPRIHQLAGLWRMFGQPYWAPARGGGLYRPVTSVLFGVEWVIGRGAALPFHLVNIGLYALVSVAVFELARRMLPEWAAWISAALFAVHPVHVEAVANAVGQSELIAALAVVSAVAIYVGARNEGRVPPAVGIGALYAVGVFAKEHAIVLPGLLLLAEATIIKIEEGREEHGEREGRSEGNGEGERGRWRGVGATAVAVTVVGVGYLVARVAAIGSVVGESPSIVLAGASYATRVWTMLGVVPEWIRLFVCPAHLVQAYSPPDTAVYTGFDPLLIPGVVVLVGVGALAIVARKKVPVLSFGLGWVGIAMLPVSNLVVTSGVLLAERTLFLASVGVVLAAGGVATLVVDRVPKETRVRRMAVGALVLVLGAGVVRSAVRQPTWRDNATLFAAGVVDAPRSYMTHYAYASYLFTHDMPGSGEREAFLAMRLYDGDARLYTDLGAAYVHAGQCRLAEPLLQHAVALMPHYPRPRTELAVCARADSVARATHAMAE